MDGLLKETAYKAIGNFVIRYLKKDPDNNVDKLVRVLKKIALNDESKRDIESIRKAFLEDDNIRNYITRILKGCNDAYLSGFVVNLLIRSTLIGVPRRKAISEKIGANVPSTILIDPTEICNLRCKGCWAGKYEVNTMPFELFDRILNEAEELGINFIVLSGGEPTAYPYLFDIASKHKNTAFMMYTNGTLIDDKMVKKFLATGNISPAISLEGWEKDTDERRGKGVFQRVMRAMDLLKANGIPFGYSITVTSKNYRELFSDEFVQFMIDKGALYGWSFHYIPVGRQPDYSAMVTPEQRGWLAERVLEIRSKYPIMLFDFWNDGELTNGCIAGGRQYFHITANANVEPCAFAHVYCGNLKDKSLKEILGNKVFKAYQKYQPISKNFLRPCPIIDRPEVLRAIVEETGATPSYEGADNILKGEGAVFLDELSQRWQHVSEGIYNNRLKRAN
ncbi:radical SAM protein [Caldanaerobius polysaccharolyticus]|uniref:radical SAM protein n=1 Tax=Caldanaerobius polysaccharolyticus TaxID=44256 RepID=UPI00054E464F|nr:radical SAM protein [Caldanaerobius polysaccharolyticus]